MELISQRVASGLDVTPSTFKKPRKRKTQIQNVNISGNDAIKSENEAKSVDWKKWGDRVALWKACVDNGKQLFTGTEVQLFLVIFVFSSSNACL
jgi:GRAM domain-containing protein 4